MNRIIIILLFLSMTGTMSAAQSIDSLIRLAANQNPEVRAAYFAFESELQKVAQYNDLPDPKVSIGYFINPIETRTGPQRARISLVQMFPWFGSIQLKEASQNSAAEIRFQEFQEASNKVILKVKLAYFECNEIAELMLLHKENIVILGQYKQLAATSFANGSGQMTDVLKADMVLEELTLQLALLENKLATIQIRLSKAIGLQENTVVVPTDSIFIPNYESVLNKDSLNLKNPRVLALEAKMRREEITHALVKKNASPQFGIGLDYAFIDKRKDIEVENNGKNALMPMVSFSIPIFRKKTNAALVSSQKAQEGVAFQIQAMENNLEVEFEEHSYAMYRAKQLFQLYTQQLEKSNQILTLQYGAYSNSGNDFDAVLQTQQQLLFYQSEIIKEVHAYAKAKASLDYLFANSPRLNP